MSILRKNNRVFPRNIFLKAVRYDSNHAANQYFYNESIFTFFATKLIGSEYDQFLDTFRDAGINILDNLRVTIKEYVDNI